MTQKQLIIEYILEHGSILPAKMYGKIYKDIMLGSETSKRCREMRQNGYLVNETFYKLRSEADGKFERFFIDKIENYAFQKEPVQIGFNLNLKYKN